jgi:hypothetical protein
MDNTGEVQFRTLPADYRALGTIIDFVASRGPFADYKAKDVLAAIKGQVATRCHVCAFRGKSLVGYCGWLPITEEMGKLWLQGKGGLSPVPADRCDAAALTIVCSEDAHVLRGLVRVCRDLGKGRRIFFKRVYADAVRGERRQTVPNRPSAATTPLTAATRSRAPEG